MDLALPGPEAPGFLELEGSLAAYVRDPSRNPPPPGVEERRLEVYRRLIFNGVEACMSSAFPLSRGVLGASAWEALLRDYLSRHRADNPLFPQVPRELLRYLEEVRGPRAADPPWLLELAHYEWVELALAEDPREVDEAGADPAGDLLAGVPVLSPLAWALQYRFPVHRFRPGLVPAEPGGPTFLLAYRDRADAVGLLELNPVTARLVALLTGETGLTGGEALARVALELGEPDPERVRRSGLEVLSELRRRGVVLGTRPA